MPTSNDRGASAARGKEGLSSAVQAQIGQGLRALFDDVAHEPIPDDLLRLLDELDARDPEDGKKPK